MVPWSLHRKKRDGKQMVKPMKRLLIALALVGSPLVGHDVRADTTYYKTRFAIEMYVGKNTYDVTGDLTQELQITLPYVATAAGWYCARLPEVMSDDGGSYSVTIACANTRINGAVGTSVNCNATQPDVGHGRLMILVGDVKGPAAVDIAGVCRTQQSR